MRFWEDKWCGLTPLCFTFPFCTRWLPLKGAVQLMFGTFLGNLGAGTLVFQSLGVGPSVPFRGIYSKYEGSPRHGG